MTMLGIGRRVVNQVRLACGTTAPLHAGSPVCLIIAPLMAAQFALPFMPSSLIARDKCPQQISHDHTSPARWGRDVGTKRFSKAVPLIRSSTQASRATKPSGSPPSGLNHLPPAWACTPAEPLQSSTETRRAMNALTSARSPVDTALGHRISAIRGTQKRHFELVPTGFLIRSNDGANFVGAMCLWWQALQTKKSGIEGIRYQAMS